MPQPDLQRAVFVGCEGQPDDLASLVEAGEIAFSGAEGISPDRLVDEALRSIRPAYYVFRESRGQINWGATGPEFQDIIIQYGSGVATGLTVAAIIATLRKVFARKPDAGQEPVPYRPLPVDSETVWRLFSDFLLRAFKVRDASPVEIRSTADGWFVRAETEGERFEGSVSADGRVLSAKHLRTKA
jgi:hypothetical protein